MLKGKIEQAVKFNMMIAIPCAVGLAVLAKPIMTVLFADTTRMTTLLMQIGAVAIVFYAYSTTTSNVLQGISKMRYPVIHAAIGLVIYSGVDFVLLRYLDMGVYALVVGHTIFPMVISILNAMRIQKETGYQQEYFKTFVLPVGCAAVMGFVAYFSYLGVMAIIPSRVVSLCVSIFFSVFTYFTTPHLFQMAENNLYDSKLFPILLCVLSPSVMSDSL